MTHYCADMCNLTELNEPSALHTVRCRYEHKLIHTLSGLFCVVVNPWQRVSLYSTEMIEYYMEQAKVQQDMPPHVYSIAQSAYDGIVQCKSDQSILITGESGAGKTENTKKIMEYLICASDRNYLHRRDQCHGIDTALISSSVALEAFSNAKTVHNNNSSRLGKFIRIDFDNSGKLRSARINCYMLEKSRVVSQNQGDRNFHIFYQFLSDAFPLRMKHSLGLKKRASDYRYLNQGGCAREDAIDDSRTAGETIRALDRLGFGKGEQQWILEVIAACILLGEIRFGERQGFDVTYPEDMQEVEQVTDIMWLSPEKLVDALTQPSIRIGDNVVKKSQNLKKTTSSVAALAKRLYERMFSWIVSRCNVAISGCGNGDDQRHGNFIGVLDMAGFEIMNKNSFEQFCINFTNEKLQQFFNHFLFVKEQSEYLSENIEWDQVDYGDDLQQTIDMIEKPMGFLSLLQEECIVPNGSDSTLLEKLVQNLSKTNVFVKAKQSAR
ncbi:Protein HUM-9 [Aphelenchoides avenae]|nr:Protein HUM-9 [Aphelenchus avenae]